MEIDYNEVFGVEGVEEQEPTEPAAENQIEGEKEQEPTEPAEEEIHTDTPKEPQSDEENRRYAAIRRKAEADAEKKMETKLDQLIAEIGFEDPYTGKKVKSKAEIDAYKKRLQEERSKEIQEKAGMSEEQYQAFVNSLPEVQKGKEAQEKLRDLEIRTTIAQQMEEIRKISPEIKGTEDLAKLEHFDELYNMIGRGYSLANAYKILYFDSLTEKAAQAAKQKALNSIGGRDHLKPSTSRGVGATPVPADVAAEYRLFMPNATDAEIQAHYNKYIGKD